MTRGGGAGFIDLLEAMEAVFGNLSQETFRKFLVQANSTEDVVTLLTEADASQLNN